MKLSHIDEQNHPKMVDISSKTPTQREALASGLIKVSEQAFNAVRAKSAKKGAVLETAIIAAIMGAKKTSELIPMCHLLMLSKIEVNVEEIEATSSFKLFVRVSSEGKTGVEMEALMGVSIGLLTIYDMLKAIDKTMSIHHIMLEYKKGGKSGEFKRLQ